MNLKKHSCLFLLATLVCLGFSTTASALEKRADGLLYANWKKIETSHNLPAHPLFIASSKSTGDYVAVAKDDSGIAHFYYLAHDKFSDGWKQAGTFDLGKSGDVDSLKSGFGKYFAFGVDNDRHVSVVATSYDNGATWTQTDIPGDAAHYKSVAFADIYNLLGMPTDAAHKGRGVATSLNGAVAVTTDVLDWPRLDSSGKAIPQVSVSWEQKKIEGLSQVEYYVTWFNTTERTSLPPDYQFIVSEKTSNPLGLLLTHDCNAPETSLCSKDGLTWSSLNIPAGLLDSSFPASLDQVLCFDKQAYYTDHTSNKHAYFSFEDQSDIDAALKNKSYIDLSNDTPLFDISRFYNPPYPPFFEALFLTYCIAIGTDSNSNEPISLVSQANSKNYRIFSVETIKNKFVDFCNGTIYTDIINQNKSPVGCCVAIDDSGDTYYTPLGLYTEDKVLSPDKTTSPGS
ncbi:MAG: hypothetical protein ACOYK6_04830 [Chthoniobacterales bacterium]